MLTSLLIEKWKKEGRYDRNERIRRFFQVIQNPRYYIIKWLTDYIADYGIDGYRADTVKHTEASVWADFKTQSEYAFATWKKKSNKVLEQQLLLHCRSIQL
jgi:alpha-amylase